MPKTIQVHPNVLNETEEIFVKNFKRRYGRHTEKDPKVVYKDLKGQLAKCKDGEKKCSFLSK